MKFIDENILERTGFRNTLPADYLPKPVILRDGREATIWVHKKTGHGILDIEFWEKQDYYSKDYRNEYGAEIEKVTLPSEHLEIYSSLNEKQFQIFSSDLTSETKFLEIGCSFGGILNKVSDAGLKVIHGVEPNKRDAQIVSSRLSTAKIFNSTFEKSELADEYYDMVVSIEVLEHVVSPLHFLKKCYGILSKNGLIHIEVPNHNDVLLSAYKDPGYLNFYYHKAHIHYFTKESLLLLCHECGFEGSVASFLMYPFFNHVWWYQNHKPQLSATTALAQPLPTAGNTPADKVINEFYKKIENEYETLINNNMLGDCLIFHGQKKNE